MLGVSLRIPEQADLGGALQKYIASNYTAEETKEAARGVTDVATLRHRMVQSVSRNAQDQDHQATLTCFIAYYKTLSCLVSRFPFQSASRPLVAEQGPSSLLGKISALTSPSRVRQVSFVSTWFDAFRHSNRVQEYDIAFERLSVLFDIAALYSRHATQIKGAAAPTASGDAASAAASSSLKEACKLFQLSSGLFEHLSRTPEVVSGALGNGLSLDLDSSALAMLSTLMLAQAQACFFEAATATASPKLVAKLAMGTAMLFRDAYVRCEKNAKLMHIFNKSDVYPWNAHCLFQSLCYQAASNYWHAKGALAEDEYGLEIAHLERARMLLAQARIKEANLLRNLLDNRSRLEGAIVARLAAANKDNETIYYSAIPKTVADPESVNAVKPLPLESATGPGGQLAIDPSKDDPFLALVSPYLRSQVDALRARVSEVQVELGKRVATAETAAKTALEQLGLPASLDALTDGKTGVPEDVWQKVTEIQYKGGSAQLVDLNARIESAVQDSQAAFKEITTQLSKEAEQDGQMRAQFTHRWNRRPSEQLTVSLQKDSDSVRRFLRDADISNTKVRADLDGFQDKFALLALSREELEARLPRATAEQSQGSQHAVAELRRLIALLGENTEKLLRLQPDFEQLLEKTDFMAQLVASQHGQPSSLAADAAGSGGAAPDAATSEAQLATALQPFQRFHAAYDESMATQTALLAQITEANNTFLSQRSSDDSTARREQFLHQLNLSVASYNKLLSNLNEGLRFYADLTRTKIAPLAQKVNDYTIARNMEATLILEQLTRDSSGFKDGAVSGGGAAGGGAGAASASGNPFADAHGSGASGAASNPNLNFESSNLYSLASPPPSAVVSPPAAAAPGGVPSRPPQQQQQQPPAVSPRPQIFGTPTLAQQATMQQPQQGGGMLSHQQPNYQQTPPNYAQQRQPQPQQPQHPPHNPYQQQSSSLPGNPFAQRPQQQQQQPSAPKEPEWQCAACTFLNPLSAQQCQMCAGKR